MKFFKRENNVNHVETCRLAYLEAAQKSDELLQQYADAQKREHHTYKEDFIGKCFRCGDRYYCIVRFIDETFFALETDARGKGTFDNDDSVVITFLCLPFSWHQMAGSKEVPRDEFLDAFKKSLSLLGCVLRNIETLSFKTLS